MGGEKINIGNVRKKISKSCCQIAKSFSKVVNPSWLCTLQALYPKGLDFFLGILSFIEVLCLHQYGKEKVIFFTASLFCLLSSICLIISNICDWKIKKANKELTEPVNLNHREKVALLLSIAFHFLILVTILIFLPNAQDLYIGLTATLCLSTLFVSFRKSSLSALTLVAILIVLLIFCYRILNQPIPAEPGYITDVLLSVTAFFNKFVPKQMLNDVETYLTLSVLLAAILDTFAKSQSIIEYEDWNTVNKHDLRRNKYSIPVLLCCAIFYFELKVFRADNYHLLSLTFGLFGVSFTVGTISFSRAHRKDIYDSLAIWFLRYCLKWPLCIARQERWIYSINNANTENPYSHALGERFSPEWTLFAKKMNYEAQIEVLKRMLLIIKRNHYDLDSKNGNYDSELLTAWHKVLYIIGQEARPVFTNDEDKQKYLSMLKKALNYQNNMCLSDSDKNFIDGLCDANFNKQ